jgi:acetoin utilization protein AcuB
MLTARDLMTEKPVTIRANATVRRAAELLQTLDIRHLPVVDEGGNLVGMLSDRDLRSVSIPFVLGDEYVGTVRAALDARVATIMNSDVLSVDEEADAAEVVDLMLDNKIGAVPVLDGDGALVGIVSYMDVLRALPLQAIDAAQ